MENAGNETAAAVETAHPMMGSTQAGVNPLFTSTTLNDGGKEKSNMMTHVFTKAHADAKELVGPNTNTRNFNLAQTHMEMACFYFRKSMAFQSENHIV